MATINSVLGPLDTADLGFTLPHEHLIDSGAGISNTYDEFVNREWVLETATEDFSLAMPKGLIPSLRCRPWTWAGT